MNVCCWTLNLFFVCWLFDLGNSRFYFILEPDPAEATLGEIFSLICKSDSPFVSFDIKSKPQCVIGVVNNSCVTSASCNKSYGHNCSDSAYTLIFPSTFDVDVHHNTTWTCQSPNAGTETSNMVTIAVKVPITTLTIEPAGNNNSVNVVSESIQTFTCTTGSSRPAAWIQWYVGSRNVTSDAEPQQPQKDGTKFISSSKLMYRGRDEDHAKSVFCKAVNIEGRRKVKSVEKRLFIQLPVPSVTISPTGVNNVVSIVSGMTHEFTCITGLSRPAAWIQWYVGFRNVTNDAKPQQPLVKPDNTTFTSSSKLMYIGNNVDHNESLYCEAINIDGSQMKVESEKITTSILVPVNSTTITPVGYNSVINIVIGQQQHFTCTTYPSRPAAWIHWYIGTRNVSNQAVLQPAKPNGTMLISSSKLTYTGNESDYNQTIHCEAGNIIGTRIVESSKKHLYILVPVTKAKITPLGKDSRFSVVSGEKKEFTCITDSSRPAAWIQWYIGSRNVTNDAEPQVPHLNGTKFISSSKLIYRGDDFDHNSSMYCEAINIEGGKTIQSEGIQIDIKVSVRSAIINPGGINDGVRIISGENQMFNCTTDSVRPAAWIQWYIGTRNVTNKAVPQQPQSDGSKYISSSILVYTGNDADHNKSVYCTAVNIEGKKGVNSTQTNIFIQIPVTKVTLKPASLDGKVDVVSNETKELTCTTDSGRPAALIQWYIGTRNITKDAVPHQQQSNGSKFISSSTLLYKGNDADHNESLYCEAFNVKERQKVKSLNRTIYIQVLVTDVTIESVDDIVSAVSGLTTTFTCSANKTRPAVWVNWNIDQLNLTNNATTVMTLENTKYNTVSYLRYTGLIKDHGKRLICIAGNIAGKAVKKSNVSLVIYSSTVADGKLMTDIGVPENKGFNISISLIANPVPTIKWTIINSTGFEKKLDDTDVNTITYNTFYHLTMYQISVAVESDYGNYTIFASNGIGGNFTHSISVEPTQKPRSPYGIASECFQTSANVTWLSNFNGGDKQVFTAVLTDHVLNKIITTKEVYDRGRGRLHSSSPTNLRPGTTYEIHVIANNTFGWVNSSKVTNCTTDSLKIDIQQQNVIGAVVGGVSGSILACIVIIIVTVSVFRHRRLYAKANDREHLRTDGDKSTHNEEDGIKDNPLYVSSGDIDAQSEVNKCKPPKKKSNGKSLGLKSQRFEMDFVYENSGDLLKDDAIYNNVNQNRIDDERTPECNKKKNKDGLLYADLEFAPGGTNKFVIRGLENRTNYAIIDLTKKAEPLSDSDEDDTIVQSRKKETTNE